MWSNLPPVPFRRRPPPNSRSSLSSGNSARPPFVEVNDALGERRATGYTTVLKLMQIMAVKGLVERDERARAHVYRPAARKANCAAGWSMTCWIEHSVDRRRSSCCRRCRVAGRLRRN